MNAPKNLRKYLDGKLPLPAGFVPLAESWDMILGVTPKGFRALRRMAGKKERVLGRTGANQIDAMECIVATLGGTSAKAAKAIGVSPRTVESWRCGRKRLTVERAYEIAQAMANH